MDNDREWFIYVLIDPRDNQVRYVGWSRNVPQRYRDHIRTARRCHTHKEKWIQSLLNQGLQPTYEIIDSGYGPDWADAERHYIATYRATGVQLTNGTDGGDGVPGFVPTAETRAKWSASRKGRKPASTGKPMLPHGKEALRAANKGRSFSPAHRLALSLAGKARKGQKTGKPMLPHVKEALRLANTGRKASPETLAKLSAAQKGHNRLTPEIVKRIADKLRGRKRPASAVEAMRRKLTGRPKSPGHIAQMRERAKRPVICVTTGIAYPSIDEAAHATGTSRDSIMRSIREGRARGGYSWERVKD